jgi:hypothetical protein
MQRKDHGLMVVSIPHDGDPWGHANRGDSIAQGTVNNLGSLVQGLAVNRDTFDTALTSGVADPQTGAWNLAFSLPAGTYFLFLRGDGVTQIVKGLTVQP